MAGKNKSPEVVKKVRQEDQTVVVELVGEVDMDRSVELRERLLSVLTDKPATLLIDMSEVDFMDSSGLATLVEALQMSRRDGVALKLAGLKKRVMSVFEISRLDSIFDIYGTEGEALA